MLYLKTYNNNKNEQLPVFLTRHL